MGYGITWQEMSLEKICLEPNYLYVDQTVHRCPFCGDLITLEGLPNLGDTAVNC